MFDYHDYANQATGLMVKERKAVQVICVVSGKGGVGKSNLSVNVSIELSKQNKRVLVMDADLGLANIDILLGLRVKKTMADVLDGKSDINDILLTGPAGIKIIPSSSGVAGMSDLTHMEHVGLVRAFSELDFTPEYLVIDCAAGLSDSVITFSRAAHEVMVVVCDEPSSITDAYALIKMLNKKHGVHRFRIVSSMIESNQEGYDLYKKLLKVTDRFLDVALEYMGGIPNDEYLKKSVQCQVAVVDKYPRAKSSMAFKRIAKKIVSMPYSNKARGNIEFFVERLFSNNVEAI